MKSVSNRRVRLSRMTALLLLLGAVRVHGAGLLQSKTQPNLSLEIVDHHVEVTLNNGFARTQVTQVFHNQGDAGVEAIYSFPLPKQSSLSEVSLLLEGRELLGEVVEKQKARQVYEEQRDQGKNTALAEKNDYRSYDVAVGVVRAGAKVTLRLVYYQPLEIDQNVGRYVYPLAAGNTDDARIPFWSVDDRVTGSFRFDLRLKSSFPVRDARVPGWERDVRIEGLGTAKEEEGASNSDILVHLEAAEGANLSRDVVFYYRLADDVPARVELLSYRASPKEEGTYMLVVTPAADLQPLPRGSDWIFVLDVSGSMSGPKISTLAEGVSRVLGDLRPEDRFRIVTFNNQARDLTGRYIPATPENVATWIQNVKSIHADGGTNLFEGLKTAYRALDEDRTTGLVLVTDGVANVGNTAHAQFLTLLREHDIRLFTFIIGNEANQPLMERLARESNGFAMNLSDADDITGRLMQAKAKVLHQALHDVRLEIDGEKVHQQSPAKPGSLYLGQQLVQFGRFRGQGPVEVVLRAKISGEERSWRVQAELPAEDREHPELERLWALSRIDEVMEVIRETGETDPLRKQVVALGTEYSLVTDYTSMLVLEDAEYENLGIDRRNSTRVHTERLAQQQREATPARNTVVSNSSTFEGRKSPGLGSGTGPVGPLFLLLVGGLHRLRGKRAVEGARG